MIHKKQLIMGEYKHAVPIIFKQREIVSISGYDITITFIQILLNRQFTIFMKRLLLVLN